VGSGGRLAMASRATVSDRFPARRWPVVSRAGRCYRRPPAGVCLRLPTTQPDPPTRRRSLSPTLRSGSCWPRGRPGDGLPALRYHLAADTGNRAYNGVAGIAPATHRDLRRLHRLRTWFSPAGAPNRPPTRAGTLEPAGAGLPIQRRAPEPCGTEKVYNGRDAVPGPTDWYSRTSTPARPASAADVLTRSGHPH